MTFDGFISYSHAADGRLAPAVQRGLHRLAKPWHRRRALWIFRDQTGLSVTPALWSSIQNALDGSEWFVLLASPEAAQSPWVNREIEHWIATKPADRILPVVTGGEWRWDPESGDLAADSTAAPDALRGVFTQEPLYLDLRWARDDQQLSLQHAQFRDAIAQLAAPMHGISKDELAGEDVRQHRRARRLRRVAVAALALLTMVASVTGVLAGHNADRATASAAEARRQQQLADQQRGNADRAAQEAQRQQGIAGTEQERARVAAAETKLQEKRAREQKAVAERAATNAVRQQQLAKRAQVLAAEQKAVAREQSELAQQAAAEAGHQTSIAEKQLSIAEKATATAEEQTRLAQEQAELAGEAKLEADRQARIAELNEQKAKAAAAEAAEQKQIALGRRLVNQAKATIGDDPTTALRLGIAAQRIQAGAETRGELAGLVTSTRQLGSVPDVYFATYGPDNVLAVVDTHFHASLWNAANRTDPVRLAPLDDGSYMGEPHFSPDGKTLAIVDTEDYRPALFDVSDPARPARLGVVPVSDVYWLTMSPDGKTLAAVTASGEWSLWDLSDLRSPALLTEQTMGVNSPITFSPDSLTVVTAGAPGTVWDIKDRTHPLEVGTLKGSWESATFSPARPLLTTLDKDGNLVLWHLDNPAEPQQYATLPVGIGVHPAVFSRDGRTLATSDNDGTARLWDMAGNEPVHLADLNDHGFYADAMSFSADGRTLATAGSGATLRLWNVRTNGEPKIIGRADSAHGEDLQMAALAPDGRRLTAAFLDGTATVWDLSKTAGPVERSTMRVRPTSLSGAAVSPDGDTVAATRIGWCEPVTLTDISDPERPVSLGEPPCVSYGSALAFGPGGHMLAAPDREYDVSLWDLTTRRSPIRLAELPSKELVSAIAFSPDGSTVAVASQWTVDLWDLTVPSEPAHLGTLKGHSAAVRAVAFSPDGRTLATGSDDRTAALWNLADRAHPRRYAVMTGNSALVQSVAFAPDGHTLATGTIDGAAALWDVTVPSGPLRLATLRSGGLESRSLLFHPDGHTLIASGDRSGTTKVSILDYSELNDLRANPTDVACALAGGGLTPTEWDAYLPETPYQQTCPG